MLGAKVGAGSGAGAGAGVGSATTTGSTGCSPGVSLGETLRGVGSGTGSAVPAEASDESWGAGAGLEGAPAPASQVVILANRFVKKDVTNNSDSIFKPTGSFFLFIVTVFCPESFPRFL